MEYARFINFVLDRYNNPSRANCDRNKTHVTNESTSVVKQDAAFFEGKILAAVPCARSVYMDA